MLVAIVFPVSQCCNSFLVVLELFKGSAGRCFLELASSGHPSGAHEAREELHTL